ncbi:hypothetical protein [Streptomyces sp. 2P-4]|uniref:hypothetical protein n=1 Tax=Streptomyces sp. 2P-4 TaxID=2931974 RepID=UPI002540D21B|nr:hypothetical protein [Streptomyces sp. 2P-4]
MRGGPVPIAALQVYSVEEADGSGGVCRVRCIGGAARTGQVYAAGDARLGLRWIERQGRRESSLGAGRAARVHLAGPAAALLAGGQVLTAVPPGGHALEELEAWLATEPPLGDEPHPMTLSSLAAAGMQDEALPDARRLRWGRVALAAVERRADWAGLHALDRAADRAGVRAYLIREFGPGRGGDPAALCRELLALIDLAPAEAVAQARVWRELPRRRIRHLRRVKVLLDRMASVGPQLAESDDPVVQAVGEWAGVRALLP